MSDNKFNFKNIRNAAATKATEKEITEGFGGHSEQGGGVSGNHSPIINDREITDFPETKITKEETQNINVPIPVSLHQQLGIIKYKTRLSMKELVVNAIREYVSKHNVEA